MANNQGTRKGPGAEALLARKLELMKEVFEASQQELLLVDLELLSPILERKEALFAEIVRIDGELAQPARRGRRQNPGETSLEQELAEVVSAILENEKTLEARIQEEQSRLREELRNFGRQTRVRHYLDRLTPPGGRINVKK